jgi:hypothetical protein
MKFKEVASKTAKGLGTVVLAIIIMVLALASFTWYKTRPINKFCDSIPTTATPASILADAQLQGLFAYDHMTQSGEISIVNQQSPFWRYACIVKFKDGKIVDKKVIAAD